MLPFLPNIDIFHLVLSSLFFPATWYLHARVHAFTDTFVLCIMSVSIPSLPVPYLSFRLCDTNNSENSHNFFEAYLDDHE